MTQNSAQKAEERLKNLTEKVTPVYRRITKFYSRIPKIRSLPQLLFNELRNPFNGGEKIFFSRKLIQ